MHDASSLERARSAVSYLNPDCDRATWVKYGMCLKHEFGDNGFDVWDEWSSRSEKYRASDARSTWKSIKADGKRTLGSLIYDAQQAGWKDDSGVKRPTREEIEARRAAAAERAARAAQEEAAEHSRAAAWAQRLWDAAAPVEGLNHPYLERKGVHAHGLRIGKFEGLDSDTGEVFVLHQDALLIPIRDRKRQLWSLQAIPADAAKKKLYLKGGAKRGHFFPLGAKPLQRDGQPVFVLGEGYATCASVHEATGHMVLCCFDVSNLAAVAATLREAQPQAVIIFAADNDASTNGNPGLTAAVKAAREVQGLVALPPPGDFNDLHKDQGLEAVSDVIATAEAPPPEPTEEPTKEPAPAPEQPADDGEESTAPTVPKEPRQATAEDIILDNKQFGILGYDGEAYWLFHHQKRQVMEVTRGNFTDLGIIELAPRQWWEMNFPPQNNRGGIDRQGALEWFVAVAHARGFYDPSRVRGRGAWRDGGRVVYHHGDYLTVDGKVIDLADIQSHWVYPMSKALPKPAPDAVTDSEGEYLVEVARMARWTRPASAALLAGWVFLAPICGALPWRPHVWITGAAGSGKSTLQSLYADALLQGIGVPLQGDSTEAGIRQSLRSDAIPALIDEFEPNDEGDRKRMKNILTLIRQSSSESSAQTVKGTVSGESMRFHVRSMFCLASINTMLDKDSDSSRITPLVLKPAAQAGAADDRWQQLEEELHKIGRNGRWPQRLLARALNLLPVVLANVDVFTKAAAKRFGTQRQGDQYGTLMAGTWCLQRSTVATEAEALAMINAYDWTDHTESTGGLGDPEKALAAIMESKIKVAGMDMTVFEIVSEAAGRQTAANTVGEATCHDILRRNGIRIEGKEMLFGVNTVSLRALAKDTPYATDLRGQLLRLPKANNYGNRTRKYAGTNSKVIAVPLALVLEDGADEPPI